MPNLPISSPVADAFGGQAPSLRRQRSTGRTAARHFKLKTFGPLAVLVLLVAVFSIAAPNFFTLANLQAILEAATVPAIVAVGMTFVLLQGAIDLSTEGIASLASIVLSVLVANSITGQDLGWAAPVLALGAGAAFGLFNGAVSTFLRMPSLIVTLASWLIALGFAALLFPGRQPQILDPRLIGLALDKHLGLSALVYLAALVTLAGFAVERLTRLGRMGYAIGADEALLRQAGIRVDVYKIAAFVISGSLSAVAGIFVAAQIGVGNPSAGEGLLFPGIAACVIGGTLLSGGRGGVFHSVMGVLILVTLRNGLVQTGTNPLLQKAIEGVVIIIAVTGSTWHLRRKTRVVK
ncbi:ABC transporter permease [Labrys sp. La1]|uniref:ABC transporter permease n=1 Tax=Labrys sp. La1 TaxID=3404917 RepID=UPI003EBA7D4F